MTAQTGFAKLGAKLHPWREWVMRIHDACRQVVKEAAIWAATHEIWLGDKGLQDAQSVTDPPLKTLPRNEVEEAEEDSLAAEAFGEDLEGHQIWAFQPLADDAPTHFGCVRFGANGTRRFR